MSKSNIPEKTRVRLWVKAGGRCQYEGCREVLWRDDLTMADMNGAYIAHIIADAPNGTRGDPVLSPQLAKEFSNLMLMCDKHHRLIDLEQKEEHPIERLQRMKERHEARIELVTSIHPDMKSEILLYGANIGIHGSPVSYAKAVLAMLPDRYPSSANGISLGMKNSAIVDRDTLYWQVEEMQLRRLYRELIKPRLSEMSIEHLSIFAAAPQPLLCLLGQLISDIPTAEVFQLHREPPDWCWQDHPENFEYIIQEPEIIKGEPALVLALSAQINRERIASVLGDKFSPWHVTVANPNNDYLKSRRQLRQFREAMRMLFDRIKGRHGEKAVLHVFPAVPVAVAVELGRVWMPKADLPLRIYDQNNGQFNFALEISVGGNAREGT